MHVLVSNHDAEIAAYRRALGAAARSLKVVENNLSVLSLVSTNLFDIRSLVITEHQDEGINVETRTFVRNLAERTGNLWTTIIVSSVFGDQGGLPVQVVDTVEDAAAIVHQIAEVEQAAAVVAPVGQMEVAANGHGEVDVATSEILAPRDTLPSPPAHHARVYFDREDAEVAAESLGGEMIADEEPVMPELQMPQETATPAPAAPGKAHAASPPPPQAASPVMAEISEPARSLADDIRNWTERNEQQRGQQHHVTPTNSLVQGLLDLLPANRRARAEEADLNQRIRAPRLTRCHSIAVISPKGGVGKSFLTYLIGNFLADVRGDKVVAIDTNPDFGTLADQVRSREQQTISTLLEQIESISHYSDLRRFTSKVETRLEVLAAPADPDVMATITAQDYDVVNTQLRHYYDTVLFDCGTGFRDDITRFALQQADQVVLVSAPLFITTGIVIRALGYLDQVGVPLDRVTLAINQVRPDKPLDLDYMRERFGSRLNAIVEIPFDIQLYHDMDRGEFSVDRTQSATRIKVKQLLAELIKHYDNA